MLLSSLKKYGAFVISFVLFFSVLLLTLIPNFAGDNFNQMRLFLLPILAVLAPLALFLISPYRPNVSGVIMALLWGLALLPSALLYPNGMVTWLEPLQFACFIIIVVCLGFWLAQQENLAQRVEQVIIALSMVAFIYAVGCLYVYFFALADGKPINDDILPWGFLNIRYWSQIASWAIPLLPVAVLAGPLKQYASWRYALYFTLAIWFWVLLLSTARGSLLALTVSFIFILVVFRKAAWPWAKVLLATAVAGAVLWLVLTNWLPQWLFGDAYVREFSSTSSGRWPLWQEAWAMSLQHFPLGMGPFSWVSHTAITPFMQHSERFGHPHHMLLFWAAEYGWLAIMPLLALVVHAAIRIRQIKQAEPHQLALLAFFASVVAAIVHSCFSAVFLTPHSLLMGLLVMTVFWSLLHQPIKAQRAPAWLSLLFKIMAGFMLVATLLWLQLIAQYTKRYYYDFEHPEMGFNGVVLPRFFEHSYIPHKDAP